MTRSQHTKLSVSALLAISALSLGSSALAASAIEEPVTVIDIPADPGAPVIATVMMSSHRYRMIVDTGAGNLIFHLPVARRDLVAVPMDDSMLAQAKGIYGDLALHHFKAGSMSVGQWRFEPDENVFALDMNQAAEKYAVDGLLGVPYLAKLSWHWDNRSRKLLGYEHASSTVAAVRARLHCEPLYDVDAIPGVALKVGDERALFALDTGDLGASGGLHPNDREALAYFGAIRAGGMNNSQTDLAGKSQSSLQVSQIQNIMLGPTRLDGLVLTEVQSSSSLGRRFLSKFDEVLLDFGANTFCIPAVQQVEPDDISLYLSK
ncbi:retropepsin-like domain-containing protein [Pseudoxanthomonas indica]|uniref:Aspartyl protease n=1 Tax=Pseudoxanthomonas indica TaxID=428993 RepID=A0A1T5LM85_9GAMM|nr:retropepsin-like domain-containing protein [Pseudoxanthomonas indica]GGD36532.1 hypothetical protein GCM10007235_05620 [Pseudoxanthomonas indica]SKC76598.1 Aspartyl protease [Pseudoxanthomonas indica]